MTDDGECGTVGENLHQCHFIPHDLTWAGTRAAAVESRRLTALAMAQPRLGLVSGLFPCGFSTNMLHVFFFSLFMLYALPISKITLE
jgi:hypothetical protein